MRSRSLPTTLAIAALVAAAGCSSAPAPSASAPTASPVATEDAAAAPLLPADTAPSPAAPLSRDQVVGDWSTRGTDYESLSLRADGSADSYLHDRPFDQGRWQLSGAELEIEWQGSGGEKVTVLGRSGAELKVQTGDGEVVWHAIATP